MTDVTGDPLASTAVTKPTREELRIGNLQLAAAVLREQGCDQVASDIDAEIRGLRTKESV